MHESMIVKLDKLQDRLIEIQEMLATPEVVNDIAISFLDPMPSSCLEKICSKL